MLTISVTDFVSKVREAIDEVGVNDANFIGSTDSENVDTIIRSKMASACDTIHTLASYGRLGDAKRLAGEQLTAQVVSIGGGLYCVRKTLQEDVMRVVACSLTDWKAPSTTFITEADAAYRMQSDIYACGTPERPVAALVEGASGSKVVEMYASRLPAAAVTSLRYIPRTDITSGNVSVCALLLDACVYCAAAMTLITFKDSNAENIMKQAIAAAQ